MKYVLVVFVVFFIASNLFSQLNQAIWEKLKVVSTENYQFQIPEAWKELPLNDSKELEKYYEATGTFPSSFNGSPIVPNIFVVTKNSDNLDKVKDNFLESYRNAKDREFPEDFNDGAQKIKLTDGSDAYILNTQYYWKSKGLNVYRYDLITYSKKSDKCYVYTLSVQCNDPDYEFSSKVKLTDFAKKVFSYFKLS